MNIFNKSYKAAVVLILFFIVPVYVNAQVTSDNDLLGQAAPLMHMVKSNIGVTTNSQKSTETYAPDRIIVKYKKNVLAPMPTAMATSAQNGDEVPVKHFRGTKSIDGLHKKHHVKGMRKVFRKHKRPAFAASMNAVTAQKIAILDGLANQDIYILEMTHPGASPEVSFP